MKYRWDELPAVVQKTVEYHTGRITSTEEIRVGGSSTVTTVLHPQGGPPVFLKGVRGISREMRWLRNEAQAGALVPELTPAVFFQEDVTAAGEDWYVVGFEHISGRPASLKPGSADLLVVASTVNLIGSCSGTGLKPLRDRWKQTDWWQKLVDHDADWAKCDTAELTEWTKRAPEFVDGDRLIHMDLHGDQFRIDDDGTVRVIDWGWPTAGASWIDTAFMVVRLMLAGHPPEQAEKWADSVKHWHTATSEAVSAFSAYLAGLWNYRAVTGGLNGPASLADAAMDYARYRLGLDDYR